MASVALSEERDLARLWATALGWLQLEVKEHHYKTFLKSTRAVGVDGDALVVEAATAFGCDWLNAQMRKLAGAALAEAASVFRSVSFVPRGAGLDVAVLEAAEVNGRGSPVRPGTLHGSIHPDFTFDRYIQGEGNRMAAASCLRLLAAEASPIGPVVLFGSPGMGKTHLLHALARRAADQGWPVACFRAEEFTNRYMTALRAQMLPDFQAAVRAVRLFILDDLQYLREKKGIQEELVHTIDAVLQAGGSVAFGSEQAPLALGFSDRLATRLFEGTSVHVKPFCFEERVAYAICLAAECQCDLPRWAIERIARIEAPSIRIVRGAVNAAIALHRDSRLDLARLDAELLTRSLQTCAPVLASARELLEKIAAHFETTTEELLGRSRKPQLTAARAVSIAALKERGLSNAEVAHLLGGRDRTTVSQLAPRGRELIEGEPALRRLAAS